MGSVARSLGVVVAVLLVGACKKPAPATDDLPVDRLDRDQLLAEQARVEKGEVVGEALRAPKIVVDDRDITINGHRFASRSDLAMSAAMAKRVEPLYVWMKGLRDHWKVTHPGRELDPSPVVSLPATMTAAEGTAVVATLAFAGYPTMAVHVGATEKTIVYDIPGLADADPPETAARLELCRDAEWKARGSAIAWQPVTTSSIASLAKTACKGECRVVAVFAPASTAFVDVLAMVDAASTGSATRRRVSFPDACPQ